MPAPMIAPNSPPGTAVESRDSLPDGVARLLAAAAGVERDTAWSAFLAEYSDLLLRVARAFGPGYDDALDRYAYMLDELRRDGCRRLRGYCADGRSRFSTWLVVVARRLCLDHHRLRFGRRRAGQGVGPAAVAARRSRRGLAELAGPSAELIRLPDPLAIDPADQVDAQLRRVALGRAIATLTPADRLLLRLRFEEELSAREIAALLGLPTPFHVYRRIAALCAVLRARLLPRAMARPA